MRRMAFLALAVAASAPVFAAAPPQRHIELNSERIGVLGLPLAESDKPVYRLVLTGEVGDKGEGRGVLVLDLTEPPAYDEFGFVTAAAPARELKLDCAIKRVKTTTKVFTVRVGGPGSDQYREDREEWSLYALTGPKLTSRLSLALPADGRWPRGRLLVHGRDGKVKHALDLTLPPQPEPCHPGCFPAGTAVRTPGGVTPIERVREGDTITTLGADGRTAVAKVEGVFVTRNRLLEVRTEGGTLVTTATQPLALEGGGFRPAGELRAGDRVWRWHGAGRRATAVLEVSAAGREAQVFNLVLGAPTVFIAGDFLVRSKPPADAVRP
jgi:hypothetical protein